jgi:hypothetical protein
MKILISLSFSLSLYIYVLYMYGAYTCSEALRESFRLQETLGQDHVSTRAHLAVE